MVLLFLHNKCEEMCQNMSYIPNAKLLNVVKCVVKIIIKARQSLMRLFSAGSGEVNTKLNKI